LERIGYSSEAIETLQHAFRILTRAGLNTTQALARIVEEVPPTREVGGLLEFIRASNRGFLK
jgi:UDP-N-acetylglucosamine acyltransferase